jgi:hypothetical protein
MRCRLWMGLAFLCVARAGAAPVRFHTDRAGFVSLNLYGPDGALIRRALSGEPYAAGDHTIQDGGPVPAGASWRAVFHAALGLKRIAHIGDFGGDRGPATAVAADDQRIYLGWSLATANADAVVACDPSGAVVWTHRRGALSGCRALAVDAGQVYVLGGEGAANAEGRAIYKLDAKTGAPIPWLDGRTDLPIVSLWPASGKYKPTLTNYMAVRNGRIYLSFSQGQFVAILDAKNGAYQQTIVGSAPGAIDAAPTQAEAPGQPGQLMEADFLVLALRNGGLGTMLLAHNPIWVLGSDLTPMDAGETITALAMVGETAKYHARDIFLAAGRPLDQVEARSALEPTTVDYVAGTPGGPVSSGVWQPERMGDIRAIALDGTGQLWVAEGDAIPSRVSVWTTNGDTGHLAHEFFAPPDAESPVLLDPLDPAYAVAGGCEWHIDAATGRAGCAGVITGQIYKQMRFAMGNGTLLLVLTPANGPDVVLQRMGPGNYIPYPGPAPATAPAALQITPGPGGAWRLTAADGFDLGPIPDPGGSPSLTLARDGRAFVISRKTRVSVSELTGLDTLQALPCH